MERKFITEYAFGYLNSYTVMLTAHQLSQGGRINPDLLVQLSKCHIYIICSRPMPYFIDGSIKHEDNILFGKFGYKIAGKETKIDFQYKWELEDDAISVECVYLFREVISRNANGDKITYVPATFIATLLSPKLEGNADLNSYEVLYIGQSIGDSGSRSAIDRLRSHSTLQKILAQTSYDYPDKEIMLFMYAYEHENIFTSLDGKAQITLDADQDNQRLLNAIKKT
ncbi:hypothetical protein [Xenorhabdus doucetiae]|uniref:hypothetical protein n=1 Tax=Xenorhabdus doucetiae TaxID=351671 RepID=UPI002B40EC39|nr:hypothetical protein [Xenorhabdus sp. 18]